MRFTEKIDNAKTEHIAVAARVYFNGASRQEPKSEDALKILRFEGIITHKEPSEDFPEGISVEEAEFLRRTIRRLFEAKEWSQGERDQFFGWLSELG